MGSPRARRLVTSHVPGPDLWARILHQTVRVRSLFLYFLRGIFLSLYLAFVRMDIVGVFFSIKVIFYFNILQQGVVLVLYR